MIGVPHETWGEVGVAFVVPAEGEAVTSDELASISSSPARALQDSRKSS